MTTKASDKVSLEIKRLINASRDRVYEAWTDPAQLKEWFGPESVQTRNLVTDARTGGKFRWDLTTSEGEEMTVRGEYRELQPDKKIVSPGNGKMMKIGKLTSASSRWNCPITKAALNCV
jgi:uncharacterized protein YndB with AHSA1/START domain